jgi:hypothetical protein
MPKTASCSFHFVHPIVMSVSYQLSIITSPALEWSRTESSSWGILVLHFLCLSPKNFSWNLQDLGDWNRRWAERGNVPVNIGGTQNIHVDTFTSPKVGRNVYKPSSVVFFLFGPIPSRFCRSVLGTYPISLPLHVQFFIYQKYFQDFTHPALDVFERQIVSRPPLIHPCPIHSQISFDFAGWISREIDIFGCSVEVKMARSE